MADTPTINNKSVNEVLSRLSKKYNSKFTIAGKKDDLYRTVGTALTKESAVLPSIKRKRVSEVRAIKALETSVSDPVDRAYEAAKVRLKFIKSSLTALKGVSTKNNAQNISSAISKLTTELVDIVTDFVDNRDNAAPGQAAEDTEFEKSVNSLLSGFKRIIATEKGRLQAEKVVFSTTLNKANKNLAELRDIDITA